MEEPRKLTMQELADFWGEAAKRFRQMPPVKIPKERIFTEIVQENKTSSLTSTTPDENCK